MSKSRGILFTGENVRGILEDRKTQTRRVIKPQPPKIWDTVYPVKSESGEVITWCFHSKNDKYNFGYKKCPYGKIGDQLYVREKHAFLWPDDYPVPIEDCNIEYYADTFNAYPGQWPSDEAKGNPEAPKWRPSIFMPRWASRIQLEITDISVERVQDISREDALAEGIQINPGLERGIPDLPRARFADLWDSINKKRGYSWESNCWVWVIEFKRIEKCLK